MQLSSTMRATATLCLLSVINQTVLAQAQKGESARPVYRAGSLPNPTEAHRVALALGEGKHVVVRLQSKKTHRGHIHSIDRKQLQIRLDHTSRLLAIAFDDVAYLEQNLTRKAKIAIIAGVAGAAVLTVFFLWLEYGD